MNNLRFLALTSAFVTYLGLIAVAQTNPRPFLNQPLIPASKSPGSGAFTLMVTGTGFQPTSVVQWNRASRSTTFVSQGKLQAAIEASDVATATTASISVVSPGPGGGRSNDVYFPVRESSLTFHGARDVNFEPSSKAIAVGDFNNDGKLDVAEKNGLQILTYLGNGDGTFAPPVSSSSTSSANRLFAVDFDGDGNLDLFVADQKHDGIIFHGNGDGTFTQGRTNTGLGIGIAFVAADFNGDGMLDLILGEPDQLAGPEVQVFINNGDGTFHVSWENSPCCVSFTGLSAVGDFNGDGKLDFVNSGIVFLGQGDGTFTTDNVFYIDTNYSDATADVSGDGVLDLISDRGAVALGKGDGTFTQVSDPFFAGINVSVGDINGDGALDMTLRKIPLTGSGDQSIEIMFGNGDGTFQDPTSGPIAPSNGELQFDQMRLGDFNNDGKLDVIVGAKRTFLLLQK